MSSTHDGTTSLSTATGERAPAATVRSFLGQLAAGDVDGACDLLADDVTYINVSTPAIRGRDRVRRVLRAAMGLDGAGFEVYFHALSSDGGAVLSERTDVLIWGPVRVQIWVCGRFDVVDGRITLWRDYFDWVNVTVALLRGLAGAVVPALRAKAPATAG